MKKIIAAAVATAFVAPAFAAEVTVTGEMEVYYSSTSASTQIFEDSELNFVATEELPNGVTVTADFLLNTTGKDSAVDNPQTEGGNSIKFAGSFGTVDFGDTANAVDAVDERSDVGYNATGYAGVAQDASLAWTLPTLVENLSVTATWSPKDANAADSGQGSGYTADSSGLALTYAMGNISASVAQVSIGSTRNVSYMGATAAFGPVTLNYETTTDSTDGSDDIDYTGMSAEYTMGDMTLYAQADDKKTGTTTNNEDTSVGLIYTMGATAFYIESLDAKASGVSTDTTYAGVMYKF